MNTNEYILKWFNGEISDETLQQLLAAEEFEFYKKLKDHTEHVELTPVDVETNYEQIKKKKTQKIIVFQRPKTRWLLYVSVAASFALFFGLYQLFYFSNHIQTNLYKNKFIVLPEQSIVTLDAGSEIEYSNGFVFYRNLKLKGTAYFEVKKGKTFSVNTEQGVVKVLGTKFNVTSESDWFEVSCFEGKVEVDVSGQKTILTAGTSLVSTSLHLKKFKITNSKPNWMSGRTEFKSVPFYIVIQSLEKRFGVSIHFPNHYKNKIFTGGFPHENLDRALQAVTMPLNLNFTINNKDINIQPYK